MTNSGTCKSEGKPRCSKKKRAVAAATGAEYATANGSQPQTESKFPLTTKALAHLYHFRRNEVLVLTRALLHLPIGA